MAQLRRAKTKDNHLYILAGQSKGTWQVTNMGEQWLQANGYRIPGIEETVTLDLGAFRLLENKQYIFTKGIEYDSKAISSQRIYEDEDIAPDIPLMLRNEEGSDLYTWNLALELSVLSENKQVSETLQCHRAKFVSASGVIFSPYAVRRLWDAFCPLQVQPQESPYIIFWEDQDHHKKALTEVSNPPRLLSNWQGNVFIKSVQQQGYWYHAFPSSSITYPISNIRWLARTPHEPDEWPGTQYRIGNPDNGWQLWWLKVQDTPVTQEQIRHWLSYRNITLLPPHQSLKIASPVDEVIDLNTKKTWYSATANQSLLIQCTPARHHISGLIRDIRLIDIAVNKNAHPLENARRSTSRPAYSDQISYFQWSTSQPGRYRISLCGDAISEPLFINVKEATSTPPYVQWLHGMHCIITSSQGTYTFHAFKDTRNSDSQTDDMSKLTPEDLSELKWQLEPDGLPVYVRWEYFVDTTLTSNSYLIHSNEALTSLWQSRLWLEIRQSKQAKVILDSGSFGLIELTFTPILATLEKERNQWCKNKHLCSELQWLSNSSQIESAESITTIPTTLYQTLLQLQESLDQSSTLHPTFQRILTRQTIPTWVYYRLQRLLQKIQKEGTMYETDSQGSLEHS